MTIRVWLLDDYTAKDIGTCEVIKGGEREESEDLKDFQLMRQAAPPANSSRSS